MCVCVCACSYAMMESHLGVHVTHGLQRNLSEIRATEFLGSVTEPQISKQVRVPYHVFAPLCLWRCVMVTKLPRHGVLVAKSQCYARMMYRWCYAAGLPATSPKAPTLKADAVGECGATVCQTDTKFGVVRERCVHSAAFVFVPSAVHRIQ